MEKTALDLLRERGHVDDEILERLGQEQFPERGPQPPPAAAPPPTTQAEPPEAEDGLSRQDFLTYHLRRERNPEVFEKVRSRMAQWSQLHPEDGRRWDTSYKDFNQAFDAFSKDIAREEHRLAGHKHPLRFSDEVAAEEAAAAAQREREERARAEAQQEQRLKAALADAYAGRRWLEVEELETELAMRVLGTTPQQRGGR